MKERVFSDPRAAVRDACETVLAFSKRQNYQGYGKHDALNSSFLKKLTFDTKWLRLLAIQAVMRSPVNIRPLLGVRA